MADTFALLKLYDDVVTRFGAELPDVRLAFGWREPWMLDDGRDAPRVVFAPGDESGAVGGVTGPKFVGQTYRSLYDLGERFRVYVASHDYEDASERAQFVSTRALFDAVMRALYHAGRGNIEFLSFEWVAAAERTERRRNAAIMITAQIAAPILDIDPDLDAIRVGADITARLFDHSSLIEIPVPEEPTP